MPIAYGSDTGARVGNMSLTPLLQGSVNRCPMNTFIKSILVDVTKNIQSSIIFNHAIVTRLHKVTNSILHDSLLIYVLLIYCLYYGKRAI